MDNVVRQFMRTAWGAFEQTGTFFPSSKVAAKRIASFLPPGSKTVVEYGAGNGVLTRRLLDQMNGDSQLIAVEILPEFVSELQKIDDPRLKVVSGDVKQIARDLKQYNEQGVSAVFSGIPFSFLSRQDGGEIMTATHDGLEPGGVFVVYQNSPLQHRVMSKSFAKVSLVVEPRNLPPYFIMVGTKSS